MGTRVAVFCALEVEKSCPRPLRLFAEPIAIRMAQRDRDTKLEGIGWTFS